MVPRPFGAGPYWHSPNHGRPGQCYQRDDNAHDDIRQQNEQNEEVLHIAAFNCSANPDDFPSRKFSSQLISLGV